MPWFGPAVLAILFITALAVMLNLIVESSITQHRRSLVDDAQTAQHSIESRLRADRDYIRLLADQMAAAQMGGERFGQRVDRYLTDHPHLAAIRQVDDNLVVIWAGPDEQEQSIIGLRLTASASTDTIRAALESRTLRTSPIVPTLYGEVGIEVVTPVEHEGRRLGALVCVYTCNGLLRTSLPREILHDYRVSIVDAAGDPVMSLPALEDIDHRLVSSQALASFGHGSQVRLERYATRFWTTGITSLAVASAGLALGMALGMWALNRQMARRRLAEAALRQVNDELEKRVEQRTLDLMQANTRLKHEMEERQQAERSVRIHQEQLARFDRLSTMGEMAAALAHELNQPLGAIAGFGQAGIRIMDSGDYDSADVRQVLKDVSEQAQRAGRVVHSLRALVEDGTPRQARTDADQIVRSVLELVEPQLKQGEVRIDLRLGCDGVRVLADQTQIQQVLLNLIRNAVEALEGVPEPRRAIALTTRSNGAQVEFAVSDGGHGCEDEVLARLFDPFFTTKHSGMGVGLAICRTIIDAHGGTIAAHRNETYGLTIRFTLEKADERNDENNR